MKNEEVVCDWCKKNLKIGTTYEFSLKTRIKRSKHGFFITHRNLGKKTWWDLCSDCKKELIKFIGKHERG